MEIWIWVFWMDGDHHLGKVRRVTIGHMVFFSEGRCTFSGRLKKGKRKEPIILGVPDFVSKQGALKSGIKVKRAPSQNTQFQFKPPLQSLVFANGVVPSTSVVSPQNQWYHFGIGAPPVLVYFSGDWDVHWGYGILTHGHKIFSWHLAVASGWEWKLRVRFG